MANAKAGKAAQGSKVAVHYSGALDDGKVFDSSEGREPLEFTIGGGQLIPGFEQAVLGMAAGEEKTVTLEPADAYGDYDSELLIEGPKSAFPEGLKVGGSYTFQIGRGDEAEGVVKEIRDSTVLVDFNHPLAGKRLTFHVRVVSVA